MCEKVTHLFSMKELLLSLFQSRVISLGSFCLLPAIIDSGLVFLKVQLWAVSL